MKLFLFYPDTASIQPIILALESRGVAVISAQGLEEAWKLMQTHARSLDIAIISREGPNGQDEAGFDLIARSKKISQLEDLPWVCVTNKWNQKQCAKHQNTPMGANAYWVGTPNEKTVISTVEAIMGTKLSMQSGDPVGSDFVLEESPFAQDGPTTAETTSGSFAIKLELPNIDFDAEASVPAPDEIGEAANSSTPPAPPEEHVFKPSEPVELSQIIEPLEISPTGQDLMPAAEPPALTAPSVAPPSLSSAKVQSPPPAPIAAATPDSPAPSLPSSPVTPPQFSPGAKPPARPSIAPPAPEQLEVSGLNAFESHAHAGITAPSLTLTSVQTLPDLEAPTHSIDEPSIVIEAPVEDSAPVETSPVQDEPTVAIQKFIRESASNDESTQAIETPITSEILTEPLGEPLQFNDSDESGVFDEPALIDASSAESPDVESEELQEAEEDFATQLAEIAAPDEELNWTPEPPAPEEMPDDHSLQAAEHSATEEPLEDVTAPPEPAHTFDVTSLQPVEQTQNLAQARAQETATEDDHLVAKGPSPEDEIPAIEAVASVAETPSEAKLDVDAAEELEPGEMSYLFAKSPKGAQTPAAQIASISAETAFAQPIGDAVVPGGAAQAPDLETLKKYLLLREQDVGVLSSQLRAAKQQIQNLEQQLRMEHAKNAELTHVAESQDKKIKEFEARKEEELTALRSEISDLKLQIRTRTDKMRLIETQMLESAEEVERIRERVKADIRKIRTREKELENRLEIMKKDSEALIVARENKIVELKRKLDLLEFNMDIMQDQYAKEKERCAVLKERLAKAAQIVRAAGGLLDHSELKAQAASVPAADESKLKAS